MNPAVVASPPAARLPDNEIFPDADFRHRLRLARAEPAAFFGSWSCGPGLLAERAHWLRATPGRCLLSVPAAAPLIEETACLLNAWRITVPTGGDPTDLWMRIAASIEPDLVLLQPGPLGANMVAAAVCFPSSWAPEDKLGHTLDEIHGVVPGLNQALGPAIRSFLDRLPPAVASLRANWGLSASPELNQHPARGLPRLGLPLDPAAVWLRIEHQALVRLPQTGGVLFGIRIDARPLLGFVANPEPARALARALRSMPESMSRYKGLACVSSPLAEWIESAVPETAA